MIKLLGASNQQQVVAMPEIELLRLHYYPKSREHRESMTVEVYVPGLGKVEFDDVCFSESTKRAIEKDCIAAMHKRMGI